MKECVQSKWLFPSQDKEKHITTRTVEKIFLNACKKENIEKTVTLDNLQIKGGEDDWGWMFDQRDVYANHVRIYHVICNREQKV